MKAVIAIAMMLAAASVATAVDVELTPGGLLLTPLPMVVSTKTGKTKAGKSANAGSKTNKEGKSATEPVRSGKSKGAKSTKSAKTSKATKSKGGKSIQSQYDVWIKTESTPEVETFELKSSLTLSYIDLPESQDARAAIVADLKETLKALIAKSLGNEAKITVLTIISIGGIQVADLNRPLKRHLQEQTVVDFEATAEINNDGDGETNPSWNKEEIEEEVEEALSQTSKPSISPSVKPSVSLSYTPSDVPTRVPSVSPSLKTSASPTSEPSNSPSTKPSVSRSFWPSHVPTGMPLASPSFLPSLSPTSNPSSSPSTKPSASHSSVPSDLSTRVPSVPPSFLPSLALTSKLSSSPSVSPMARPTAAPSNETSEVTSPSPSIVPTGPSPTCTVPGWCPPVGVSPTSEPSTSTSPTCTSGKGWCAPVFRRLSEKYTLIKEDLSVQERLQVIDSLKGSGAKHDATFSFKYGLISKTSCSALTKNLKSSYEDDIASRDELPVGTADLMDEKYTSWLSHSPGADVYSKKLYTNDLVQMIGRDETLTILDFFEKSLGGLSIDTMYLSLHRNPGDAAVEYNVDWHVDTYATLEINLNDDYAGGHVFHLNGDGVYKTKSRVGSAIAHKDDIVHGISPKKDGARYMLILKHHFNLPEKEGVVRLSRELIGE